MDQFGPTGLEDGEALIDLRLAPVSVRLILVGGSEEPES